MSTGRVIRDRLKLDAAFCDWGEEREGFFDQQS